MLSGAVIATRPTLQSIFKVSSVNINFIFGNPTNENINIGAKFSVYTQTPSPLMYSPQMLQYENLFLDRINQELVNSNYSGISGMTQMIVDAPVNAPDNAVIKYQSQANDLPSNVQNVVKIFGPKREMLEFNFSGTSAIAKLSGELANRNYNLVMIDANGNETTSNPTYYDMYIGGGKFIRYATSTGKVVFLQTASGRRLYPDAPSVGLEAIYDTDESVRQIYSIANGLADIVITEANVSYEVRIYAPPKVGPKVDGVYTAIGTPHTVWRFENPNPGQNTSLKVTKTVNGASEISLYEYSHNSEGWRLIYPDQIAVVTQSQTWDYSRTVKSVTSVDRSPDGKFSAKSVNMVQAFPFGDRTVAYISDPDGANLRTSYTYYTDSGNAGSYGRMATENNPDGSWTSYQYDGLGRKVLEVSPWKNSAFNSLANEANAVYYGYEPHDVRDVIKPTDERPRTVEVKIQGITVQKTYYAYYFDGNQYVDVMERCRNQGAAYGDSSSLRIECRYYAQGDCTSASAGRIQRITYPDNTIESYAYEYGTFQQNANPAQSSFTPGAGSDIRMTIIHGTTTSPAGVAHKTIRFDHIINSFGNTVFQSKNVYTGSSYEQMSWHAFTFDELNRPLSQRTSNDELTEYTWNCCRKESETFPDGSQYTYAYDVLKRLVLKTKVGIGNQPDILTAYEYDASNLTGKDITKCPKCQKGNMVMTRIIHPEYKIRPQNVIGKPPIIDSS
jgi:YD repeat-containing protein